jgi:hypothetical protein
MKTSILLGFALLCTSASAFTTSPVRSSTITALHLFGGGGNKDADKKGPSMMDQLAMFKKAQEMAQKKQKLDEELKKEVFIGTAADGKVKATFKFVPVANPLDPNPDYEPTGFEFDDEFYNSASAEELSEAVYAAILSGIEKTNMAVAQKYVELQNDLMEAFGQKQK